MFIQRVMLIMTSIFKQFNKNVCMCMCLYVYMYGERDREKADVAKC